MPVCSKLLLARFPRFDKELLRLSTGSPLITRLRSIVGVSRNGIGCVVSSIAPFDVLPWGTPVCLRRGIDDGGSRGVLNSESRATCDCACTSRT
jgi:hypothetical protein